MSKFNAYVGNIIAQRRRELHVSQRELEPLIGLGYSSFCRCERGSQPLTLMQFVDICRMLDLDAARLMGELNDYRIKDIRTKYAEGLSHELFLERRVPQRRSSKAAAAKRAANRERRLASRAYALFRQAP